MARQHEYYGDERRRGHNNHPVHIEFVAIPSYFDINSYLSMREVTGMFMSHDITLKSVTLIAEAVKEGPVFTLSSPTGTYCASALFVIEIFKQVGLTIKAFSNFLPVDIKSYESILKNTTFKNADGKPTIDMTVIFINLYKLVEEGVLGPVIESIIRAEDYAGELEDTLEIYNSK
jgi:hypothetical protein